MLSAGRRNLLHYMRTQVNGLNAGDLRMMRASTLWQPVAQRTGVEVRLGRLNWHADSYHIYGKDIEQAEALLFSRLQSTAFEERVYNFHDELIQQLYREDEASILEKIARMNARMSGESAEE